VGRWLTVGEVATKLGIGPDLVARYCKEGRFVAERPGRDWMIEPGSVDRFEESRRAPGRPPSQPPPSGA
jgi:excisionase family DNA binding protein